MDEALQSWLEGSHHQLVALTGLLRHAHQMRCTSLVQVMQVLCCMSHSTEASLHCLLLESNASSARCSSAAEDTTP